MAITEGTNAGFVTIAPTADPAGTGYYFDDYCIASKFTAPAGITSIIQIGIWIDTVSEAADMELGIYSHDAVNNRPDVLLASATFAKGTTAGWKTALINCAVTPGTIYWLACQMDNTATATKRDMTSNASYRIAQTHDGQTALPSPGGTTFFQFNLFITAIYALYSVLQSYSYVATGGGIIGGAADLTRGVSYSGGGGGIMGGAGAVTKGIVFLPTGGGIMGGTGIPVIGGRGMFRKPSA